MMSIAFCSSLTHNAAFHIPAKIKISICFPAMCLVVCHNLNSSVCVFVSEKEPALHLSWHDILGGASFRNEAFLHEPGKWENVQPSPMSKKVNPILLTKLEYIDDIYPHLKSDFQITVNSLCKHAREWGLVHVEHLKKKALYHLFPRA